MISVCMIAKNEENNIVRCLSSLTGIAQEIILVDTGSTDYTTSLASSYGATVYLHPFCQDFSEVRNFSIEKASGDWIFYIDCDEQLDEEKGLELLEIIKQKEIEGICLSLCNIIQGKKQLTLPSLRLFRNKKEYRFRGKIHEQIQHSIEEHAGKNKIYVSKIPLYHYGYDGNCSDINTKIARNISIFESYHEEEKDGFYYYNLGNEYLRIGEQEKALDCYEKAEKGTDKSGYKIYLPVYKIHALIELNQHAKAIEIGLDTLKHYPNYKDMHFLMTSCYYHLNEYKKAHEHLEKYVEYFGQDCGYPEFNLDKCNDIPAILNELSQKIKISNA